jgi:uncharacterized phosphosugar-binding protein
MSEYREQYFNTTIEIFKSVLDEGIAIEKAAGLMAQTIIDDKLIHVIGTGGHSNMGAQEMLWRAGGLVPINAILDWGTALINGAKRSNVVERLHGYAKAVFDSYRIEDGIVIIVNAYGINPFTIDSALEAVNRGIPTIGVTSTSFAENVPSGHPARHKSNKNLHELVDVFVNCHLPYGDAAVKFENLEQKVAPTATLANTFTVNLLVVETVKILLEKGFSPPLWVSANVPGGDLSNKKYEDLFGGRVKHLL